jgi:RNase P subunit RPR2
VPTLKKETSQINNLIIYLKLLEKQEQTKPHASRQREIIKITDEIKTKKTIQRINERKSWFFKKSNKINKPIVNMTTRGRGETQKN